MGKKVFNRITKGRAGFGSISMGGGVVQHVKRLQIRATPTGAEQDTGWDLPDGAVVTDVMLKVVTAEATGATKTIDVGLKSGESGGDADGFLNSADVSTTGTRLATLASGVSAVRGELLREDTGTSLVAMPHIRNATAKSVTYTAAGADWAEFRGDIILFYLTGL